MIHGGSGAYRQDHQPLTGDPRSFHFLGQRKPSLPAPNRKQKIPRRFKRQGISALLLGQTFQHSVDFFIRGMGEGLHGVQRQGIDHSPYHSRGIVIT